MSQGTHVASAAESDLAVLAEMRLQLGWHPNPWLLRAVHRCDLGRIFLVRADASTEVDRVTDPPAGSVLAAAAAVGYGARGFIGNVMVHAEARRRGLGRAVMVAALDWLRSRQTAIVELDATPEGRHLYERLGFVGTQRSWFIHDDVRRDIRLRLAQRSAPVSIEPLGPHELAQIERLDRAAFGGDRLGLLRHILAQQDSSLFAARDEARQIVGYLISRPLDVEAQTPTVHVGPWVAVAPGVAAALLLHALQVGERGRPESSHGSRGASGSCVLVACIAAENHRSLGLARACGISVVEDDLRMRLGLLSAKRGDPAGQSGLTVLGRPDWVYAMTAPMVG